MSCNNYTDDLVDTKEESSANRTFLVPENQAIEQAISFFKAQGATSLNKKRAKVKRRALTPSASGATHEQEGVYIVNFENNGGFAVVSADKRDGASVYLASEEGYFNENDEVNRELLSAVKDYQEATISSRSFNPDKDEATQVERTVVEESYGPLLNTCWHQNDPFNDELYNIYSTSCYVGCVPIAIGQILNYYQYPNSIRGEYLDWSLIAQASGYEVFSTTATAAASRLLYLVGIELGINYPTQSSATFDDAVDEFSSLGYLFTIRSGFDVNIVKNQVAVGNPVFMSGHNDTDGHAWVADGFQRVKIEHRTYDQNGNLVENTALNDYNYDATYNYVHLNLGWGPGSLYDKTTSLEYESSNDHRIWTYTDIFEFYYNNRNHAFNNRIKMIYGFSHQ